MFGDNHNRIPDLDAILSGGDQNAAIAVDACHEQIFLEGKILERTVCYSGRLVHTEFNGFHTGIKQVIQRFNIAVGRVCLCTDLGNDGL